ncbi:MAG: 3-dehydroquinate synthase [Bacteroidetes bacterium GWE2_32_14]|nr:MAG: 3-dehydroquinate synthase [Bacteroidetes bacterium GWE2_32_14]
MKKNQFQKEIWIDCLDVESKPEKIALINNLSFENILVKAADIKKFKLPKKTKVIVEVVFKTELKDISEDVIVMSSKNEVLEAASKSNHKTAYSCKIIDQESMNKAWKIGEKYDYVVVELISETNIPLELLIAKLQKTNTTLIKKVLSVQDAEISFGVMEAGSDGILFQNEEMNEIVRLNRFLQKQKIGKVELLKGKVVNIQHAGMGYRACIDTTDLLKKNEGMIVGSTSEGGLLISSETHFLPYMELRPFRVNAGAVHSYVWCPDDNTAYITELKAGSKVLCVDTDGNTREVVVGRVKTELRPLLKIEVEVSGKRINTFVQDDWHIRIFGGNGEPRNASEIKNDDELLVYLCESGRHVGIKIDESIEEK